MSGIGVLSLVVFVAVAGFSAGLGIWVLRRRGPAVERLLGRSRGRVAAAPASPSMAWRELVSRIGGAVPLSPKSAPRLKRMMIRAGFRHPGAVRVFHGARAVGVIVLAAGGALWQVRHHEPAEGVLTAAAAGAAAGFMAPMQYLRWRTRGRRRAIARGLPNALDLMVVCVESGLGLDQTMVQVARELEFAYPEICDEFAVMNLELRAGKRRAEALHNLADRTGVDDVRKLVAVLVQTDRFGTSIAQTLRGHADYMRVMARQRAEEKAAKLAVKLVFPIFICILPSLFVVTVGPVLTRLVRDLLPMIDRM